MLTAAPRMSSRSHVAVVTPRVEVDGGRRRLVIIRVTYAGAVFVGATIAPLAARDARKRRAAGREREAGQCESLDAHACGRRCPTLECFLSTHANQVFVVVVSTVHACRERDALSGLVQLVGHTLEDILGLGGGVDFLPKRSRFLL
eukprot:7389160-Prymnesium_polylepis.1